MRLILAAVSILALLLAAVVVVPNFMDWNKFKPQIITQVEKATGLKVIIEGDLGVGLLPTPHVTVNDFTIASPNKIEFENILTMKSAQISVDLLPLLQKKVIIDSVKLENPKIQVEMMPNGTPSWTIEKTVDVADDLVEAPVEQAMQPVSEGKKAALDSISLESLEIENGEFVYIDHRTKSRHSAQDVNLTLEADSLNGPFDLEGSLSVDGKEVEIDAETGRLPEKDEPLTVEAEVSLPEADTAVSFNGVAAIKAPYDVQGQANIDVGSPQKLAKLFDVILASQYDRKTSLNGLLSANDNSFTYNDLKLGYGDFVGNGKISVQDFKQKNPVKISGNLKSSSILDIDSFMATSKTKAAPSANDGLKNAGKASSKSAAIIPQTIRFPLPIDLNFKMDVAGVKVMKQNAKGVFVDIQKTGATSKINFKALELPGQAKADGVVNVAYASSSKSPKTGQVVYSDPSVSYAVNGQVGQLKGFLNAFAPDADTSAVTNLYKTAQFNLKGAVAGNAISLKDSTMKLDNMVVGLGGRYQPATNGARAKATIDVSAGTVDFDRIMAASGKKSAASKPSAGSSNPKQALEPVKELSLPLDLVFDVSIQKARINQADLEGLRVTGSLIGKNLILKNASVNNFAGAAISAKGQVANLSNLSGMDVSLYTKTSNLGQLANALKVDISKLPKGLKALEANVSGKGAIENLAFAANVKALGGQVDASGQATNLLDKPAFDGLTVGLKHPNLVQAIRVVNPGFSGAAGLNQAINLSTKMSSSGNTYNLSDMKVTLGDTNFGGNLKINTGSKIMGVSGNIQAGKIALDSLLGAKKFSGGSSSSSGGASSSSKSSGRWSTAPIDLSFMNTVDVDVALSAQNLTYGAWNFTNPSTDLKIGGGQMKINGLKAGVFGGTATLNTEVKASPVSLAVSSNMNNINLESLVKSLSGSSKLKTAGAVDFALDVNSTGGSANALINALNGKADLNGRDVTIKGFDLAKLARGLATEEKLITSALSLVDGAMSGGQTKFDTVKGDYKITSGKVNIQSMVMDSSSAVINSTGYADLPSWFINVDNAITLKGVEGLKPFEVKIKGSLSNPTDTFGKNILEDYIQDKFKRKINKELGDKLPDILGDDATNALQKFGILPKKEKAAPKAAPTAAPEGANDNAPAEVAPQPVAPAPKKIEKPKDALDAILNSDKPEDAVNNVLKGLF